MSKFDAGTQVEALDYDFTTLPENGSGPYEGKGTVPEPSNELIAQTFQKIRSTAEEAGVDLAHVGSEAELIAALASASENALETMNEGMLDAVSDLCQGSPTREQIEALPYRVQQAFTAWLLEQFSRPTTSNAATKP